MIHKRSLLIGQDSSKFWTLDCDWPGASLAVSRDQVTMGDGGGDSGQVLVWGRGLEWPEIISYFWYITFTGAIPVGFTVCTSAHSVVLCTVLN